MYVEGRHDDGRQKGESEDADRYIAMADVILGRNGDTTIEPMDEPAYKAAPKESDGDIARIVHTQVETGITIDK